MDLYKKRPLKYSHENVRRDMRHTETLKARESSRFKRLSIIRDISQSDYGDESVQAEAAKPDEVDQKVEQVPISRLELMKKWKQEKILKKQLEAKSKAKPFYAGRNTNSTGIHNQDKPALKFCSNISFTASKLAESRFESSVPKPASSMNKASSIPSIPKRTISAPSSTANHMNAAAKSGNIGNRLPGIKNTFAGPAKLSKTAVSSQKPKQESTLPKLIFSKVPSKPLQKVQTFSKVPNKPLQKESGLPKLSSSKLPSIPLQKGSAPSVIQKSTAYGKVQSKAMTSSVVQKFAASAKVQPKTPTAGVIQKSTTSGKIQTKTPTSSIFQKSASSGKIQTKTPTSFQKPATSGKIQPKETQLQTKNIPVRKGFSFKKAAAAARKEEAESKKILSTASAKQESNEKLANKPNKGESISQENIPDFTLHCDVSIIKRKQSFAPDDFKFQPPSTLTDFMFEDDDDNPYAILEDFKVKYMSRTSTPTKKENSSSEGSVFSSRNSPPAGSMPSKNELDDSSLNNLQTANQDYPAVSITRQILENLSNMSCSMSPEVNSHSDIVQHEKVPLDILTVNNDAEEKKVDIDEKFGDCDNEHIQNTGDKPSKYSEKLCDEIVRDSNDENSIKKEVKEDYSKAANGGDEFAKETYESCGSPFDIVDVNKINDWDEETDIIKFDEEKFSEKVELIEDTEIPKGIRKSSRISCKRVSMLQNISKLNIIDENIETEDSIISSNERESSVFTPRRSVRLLHKRLDSIKDSPSDCVEEDEKLISISPFTPRRSLRLQKAVITSANQKDESVFSPCKMKTPKYGIGTRRSMRLIDLNTPEKDTVQPSSSKSNLTAVFERLNLNEIENRDPNALLIGVENSPSASSEFKSRKVSLLYSPVKGRKSIRKSIKGDLMCFSPAE